MPGDRRGVLDGASVFQISGDARSPEAVAADVREPRFLSPFLHHTDGGEAGHGFPRQLVRVFGVLASPEERPFPIIANAGGLEVFIQVSLGGVVSRDAVEFPALFVESEEGLVAQVGVIADEHVHRGGDPGEGEDHHSNEGPVTEPDQGGGVDAVEELPHLPSGQDRGFSDIVGRAVLRPPDGGSRIERDHLPGNHPIEEHLDGGEVLFYGRRRSGMVLYIEGNAHGRNGVQGEIPVPTPVEELMHGGQISDAGVLIADLSSEKLHEAGDDARPFPDDDFRDDVLLDPGQNGESGSPEISCRNESCFSLVHDSYFLRGSTVSHNVFYVSRWGRKMQAVFFTTREEGEILVREEKWNFYCVLPQLCFSCSL